MTLSLADLAAADLAVDGGLVGDGAVEAPSWADLFELQRYLRLGLTDLLADRGDDGAPLRLTKGRVRTASICPAQVLGETNAFGINFSIAVGIVCDAAAGILALHPGFRPIDGWFWSLRPSLSEEHAHLIEFVDAMEPNDQVDFGHVVDDLCGSLPELLGDLRPHRPTVHDRIAFVPVPGVHITGEVDLAVDLSATEVRRATGRILAEVKSGRFSPRISDELAHYALITLLRGLPAAIDDPTIGGRIVKRDDGSEAAPIVVGCSISLGDLTVTPVPLGIEVLEKSARRLLETTRILLTVDEAMKAGPGGTGPATNPGDHCRWCRRVAQCGDAPDLVLAELDATLRPLESVRPTLPMDGAAFDDAVAAGVVDDDPVGVGVDGDEERLV